MEERFGTFDEASVLELLRNEQRQEEITYPASCWKNVSHVLK